MSYAYYYDLCLHETITRLECRPILRMDYARNVYSKLVVEVDILFIYQRPAIDTYMTLWLSICLYRENAIAIQDESGYSNGGNV